MRVLVTGSAGFIGRHFVAAFKDQGHDVITSDPAGDGVDCRLIFETDFKADLVVHCAALTGGIEGITSYPAKIGAVNAQLDGALFDWALRTNPGRVVYISSSCVYPLWRQGSRRHQLFESDALDHPEPDATYGWVKLAGEVIAEQVRNTGVPVSIVRPFAVYGQGQNQSHVVPMFVQRALSNSGSFDVWGSGRQTHDFIHVDDCVAAVLAMVKEGIDGPVNIGTGIGTSVDEVATMAMYLTGQIKHRVHLLEKPVGVEYRVADVTKLHEFYIPKISLKEGITRMVEAACK